MQRSETIRGLERGLQVLDVLQSNPIASLHDIHVATTISKPSLLRILNTLERAGVVSRRLADGHYRISAFTRMAGKRDRHDRIAEAGMVFSYGEPEALAGALVKLAGLGQCQSRPEEQLLVARCQLGGVGAGPGGGVTERGVAV